MTSTSAISTARRWWQRGSANHGWLRTSHTFSFSSYYDPKYMSFGPLRVINEDRVAPRSGFPTHPHANAEIFSYILDGELTHKDSIGNIETLKRGEIQFTSAGKGVRHSEYNDNKSKECHFLQIWYTPNKRNLPPRYYTQPQVPDADKTDKFMTLIRDVDTFSAEEVEKTGLLPPGQAIPAHAHLTTRACILTPGHAVQHTLGSETTQKDGERWVYVHLAMNSGWKDSSEWERQLRKDLKGYEKHADQLQHAVRYAADVYGVNPPWTGKGAKLGPLANKPRVTLTYAQSRDGKIAGADKKMLALSGQESMIMTHTLRTLHDGILVGAGTVKNDNPQLNARLLNPLPDGTSVPLDMLPTPIVLDPKLETPVSCQLIVNYKNGTGKAPIIVTASGGDASKLAALKEAGFAILEVPAGTTGRLEWHKVLADLQTQHGLQSIMIEGGARVIESIFEAHQSSPLIDHLIVTLAPVTVGNDGLGYRTPAWVTRTMNPSPQGAVPAAEPTNLELLPTKLDPHAFKKDLVFTWSSAEAAPSPPGVVGEARIRVNGSTYLEEGDGVFIRKGQVGDQVTVENVGESNAEFVLFDVEPGHDEDDE